jgi:hypothetical protein
MLTEYSATSITRYNVKATYVGETDAVTVSHQINPESEQAKMEDPNASERASKEATALSLYSVTILQPLPKNSRRSQRSLHFKVGHKRIPTKMCGVDAFDVQRNTRRIS